MEPSIVIDVVTLFPQMMEGFVLNSVLGRAIQGGIIKLGLHNLRKWADGPHYCVDDRPFGGGAGMVLKAEVLGRAIEELRGDETEVVYLCPDGERLTGGVAKELAGKRHLLMISGHYEGIDERVREIYVDREVSIGDYVLTNGTLAAAVVIDAVCRHISGVLGEEKSLTQDSFNGNLLSFPQYTRPAEFQGLKVPEILLSGNHKVIENWRTEQKEKRTRERRPDLFQKYKESKSNHGSTDKRSYE